MQQEVPIRRCRCTPVARGVCLNRRLTRHPPQQRCAARALLNLSGKQQAGEELQVRSASALMQKCRVRDTQRQAVTRGVAAKRGC